MRETDGLALVKPPRIGELLHDVRGELARPAPHIGDAPDMSYVGRPPAAVRNADTQYLPAFVCARRECLELSGMHDDARTIPEDALEQCPENVRGRNNRGVEREISRCDHMQTTHITIREPAYSRLAKRDCDEDDGWPTERCGLRAPRPTRMGMRRSCNSRIEVRLPAGRNADEPPVATSDLVLA